MNPENPTDNQKAKPNAGREPNKQSAPPTPEVPGTPTQSQAKPSPHGYKITCDKKRDWIDKAALGLEGFGLFVLIVYTIATIVYACITYHMWRDSNRNFTIDERAWVYIPSPAAYQLNGTFISAVTQMTNTGKTPATGIEGDFIATILNRGEDFSFDFSLGHPHNRLHPIGVIFPGPGASIPVNFTLVKYGPKSAETIVPDDALRQDIANGKRFIIVYGRVTYFDAFGSQHWTQFCYGSGDAILDNLKKCLSYNDVDHN